MMLSDPAQAADGRTRAPADLDAAWRWVLGQAAQGPLVCSFAGQQVTYAYDQAIVLVTAVLLGHDGSGFADGLMAMQRDNGGFTDCTDSRDPSVGDPVQRSGISAVCTYALLLHLDAAGASKRDAVEQSARSGLNWLLAQRRSDGLIGAGHGDYRADGSVDAQAQPGWASSEHNIDTWHTLRLAERVLGGGTFGALADELTAAIMHSLWDAQRLLQGRDPAGYPDRTDPLDVNSWGSLFLRYAGREQEADAAVARLALFSATAGDVDGYRAYYPQPAFPQAPANVWVEGTAGVALARARTGDLTGAEQVVASLAALQNQDGSFPYAVVDDGPTGMTSRASSSATCWAILASLALAGHSIWDVDLR